MRGRAVSVRVVASRAERGLSASVQWSVLTALLMLIVIGIIQVGVWVHGRNIALRAAEVATDELRGRDADLATAQAAARHVTAIGGLQNVTVEVERGETQVAVVVGADPPTFFDLGLTRITQRAAAPVERVRRP